MTTSVTPPARPGPDRFLVAILVGLAALLVLAGGAIVLARQGAPLLPADTPGGTIQRFYQALDRRDYDTAYSLLSDTLVDKPTSAAFNAYYLGERAGYRAGGADRLRITEDRVSGESALLVVEITHYYNNPGPLGSSSQWSEKVTFTLHREAGSWRISELPYGYLPPAP